MIVNSYKLLLFGYGYTMEAVTFYSYCIDRNCLLFCTVVIQYFDNQNYSHCTFPIQRMTEYTFWFGDDPLTLTFRYDENIQSKQKEIEVSVNVKTHL